MNKYISENEDFVNLIQIAKDDDNMKNQLISILGLDPINRKKVLNDIITKMKNNNESKSLIDAFTYLLDDDIASKAYQIINN
jgi:ribulose bisphosphate carboxylase small subunit